MTTAGQRAVRCEQLEARAGCLAKGPCGVPDAAISARWLHLEGAPRAMPSIPGVHGCRDHDLDDPDDGLQSLVPERDVRRDGTERLEHEERHPQRARRERD